MDVGILTQDKDTLTKVLTALSLAGKEEPPLPIPRGVLAGCVACGHTAASHFRNGSWTGCVEAEEGTVFVLVPVSQDRVKALPGQQTNGHHAEPQTRGFRRAVYRSTLHHKAKPSKVEGISETRLRVLAAIHKAGKSGLLAKQIIKATRLPHGSVQQTLNWLRAQSLVRAEEATPKA